jgi:hypothetical protein
MKSKMPKKKTLKNTKKKVQTRKSRKCAFPDKSTIVKMLMEMLNIIKLYHWKTLSYAAHIATDELYEKLDGHIDKFVEVYLGKTHSRINKWESQLTVIQYNRKQDFRSKILEYIEKLTDLNLCLNEKKDMDLINIRDDILVDLNQFLYLLSFK